MAGMPEVMALVPHSSTPSEAVRSLVVEVTRNREALILRYVLSGDLERLRVPEARAPARVDGLWRHTCFELFVLGGAGYLEFNFSPSGEWAAYRFTGYREGQAPLQCAPPRITARALGAALELQATVAALSGRIRLACSAVVEEAGGSLCYWALRQPLARPDFHHEGGYALEHDEIRH
jgi:hypothetical protein